MKNKEFKVFLAIIALIVTLGVLLGGYSLYKKYGIQGPLIKELSSHEMIEKAEIDRKNDKYIINLQLNKVENIQKQYTEVEDIINTRYKPGDYDLIITGRPNEELEQFYEQLQPAVYEALADNRYLWLSDHIENQAAGKRIAYRMFVDEKRLYIQIENNDNFFYKIINRNTEILNND